MSQVTSQRGRPFVNGNPGRRPGSRNRASVVAAALVEGECEELMRKAPPWPATWPCLNFYWVGYGRGSG